MRNSSSNRDSQSTGRYLIPAIAWLSLAAVLGVAAVLTYSLLSQQGTVSAPPLAKASEEAASKSTATEAPSAITPSETTEQPSAVKIEEEKRLLALDGAGDGPLRLFHVINAHEHLYMRAHLPKYLAAAEELGIVKTLFVASSDFTMKGSGSKDLGNDWNTREILACEAMYPEKIVTFATFHPNEANKVELLQEYVRLGVRGLKLYTGHGNFWDRPLDTPEMAPVYAYCESTGLPICWHVNLSKTDYFDQFQRVLQQYPRLKIIVPHFGVTFYRPGDSQWQAFWKLIEQYPGLFTDCSWGTRAIMVQGLEVVSANVEMFRQVFNRYQDRIMWGTDMVVTGNKEKTQQWIASVLRAQRNMLEKRVYHFAMAADGHPNAYKGTKNPYGRLNGLNLDDIILKKVYETNYETFMSLRLE